MNRLAYVFPGQGSQTVGMGRDFAERFPSVGELYARADDILGVPLSRLCFEGPESELTQTENTQPALFVTSAAILLVLTEAGVQPSAAAGHSLGEYSALLAAGAVTFEDALPIVRRRGELMAAAARETPGAMAAIIGLTAEAVQELCREVADGQVVEPANFNAPQQTVVSGEREAVERAIACARGRGARATMLNVSAPFHCSLMQPVRDALQPALATLPISDPSVPVVANVTGQYVRSAEDIRRALLDQIASPVQWVASIQLLRRDAFADFIEVGPGRVLAGLLRSIDRGAKAYATGTVEQMKATLTELEST